MTSISSWQNGVLSWRDWFVPRVDCIGFAGNIQFETLDIVDGLGNNYIEALSVGTDNTIWIGTDARNKKTQRRHLRLKLQRKLHESED